MTKLISEADMVKDLFGSSVNEGFFDKAKQAFVSATTSNEVKVGSTIFEPAIKSMQIAIAEMDKQQVNRIVSENKLTLLEAQPVNGLYSNLSEVLAEFVIFFRNYFRINGAASVGAAQSIFGSAKSGRLARLYPEVTKVIDKVANYIFRSGTTQVQSAQQAQESKKTIAENIQTFLEPLKALKDSEGESTTEKENIKAAFEERMKKLSSFPNQFAAAFDYLSHFVFPLGGKEPVSIRHNEAGAEVQSLYQEDPSIKRLVNSIDEKFFSRGNESAEKNLSRIKDILSKQTTDEVKRELEDFLKKGKPEIVSESSFDLTRWQKIAGIING
jgi:hypothetical protein